MTGQRIGLVVASVALAAFAFAVAEMPITKTTTVSSQSLPVADGHIEINSFSFGASNAGVLH